MQVKLRVSDNGRIPLTNGVCAGNVCVVEKSCVWGEMRLASGCFFFLFQVKSSPFFLNYKPLADANLAGHPSRRNLQKKATKIV